MKVIILLYPLVQIFSLFRQALNVEMKDATSYGLQERGEESHHQRRGGIILEFKFIGNLSLTAQSLLNTVYFYNGKLFGLRGSQHRNLIVNHNK